MTTLEKKTAEAEKQRAVRYPLWDLPNNRKELREISERAAKILTEGENALRPEIEPVSMWEIFPRVTMEVLQAVVNYLVAHRSVDVSEVYLTFGKLFEIGIEFMVMQASENPNSFNPKIVVLDELKYEMKDVPYDDLVSVEDGQVLRDENSEGLPIQFFNERQTLYEIVKGLISYPNGREGLLMTKYGIAIFDWTLLYSIVVAFFRSMKEYLLDHKDDQEVGLEFDLGRIIKFGISRNGDDDDDDYDIFIIPGQEFKVAQKHNAEGDKGVK